MALTPLVNIPSPSDPANFASEADNFISVQLPNLVSEWNNDIALFNNQDTRSTSTTSLVVGTGTKSLTVGAGKMYQPNMTIRIGAASVANTYMEGVITSYNSTTGALVVNVIYFLGTGTIASWNTFLVPSIFAGGNLGFTGTGNRITGDFSNTTPVNKIQIQSSTTNGATIFSAMPNGTSATSSFQIYNSSELTNFSFGAFTIDSTACYLSSTRAGTGSFLPLVFYTNNSERMKIDTSGNVLVGNSTNDSGVGTSAKLFVRQNAAGAYNAVLYNAGTTGGALGIRVDNNAVNLIRFDSGATNVGSFTTNGTTTTFNNSSDYRLKENITTLVGSGDFIDALKPKTWIWKATGKVDSGFIAHEFAEVSPQSVTGKKDAVDENGKPIYQGMQASTHEVMANIISEIQSLRKRVAELENV